MAFMFAGKSGRLHEPARQGDAARITQLLASGAKADGHKDGKGWTPLMDASFFGHADCIEALLAFGANADVTNKSGQTALDIAELAGKTDCVTALKRGRGLANDFV
jgi:ankyrin repeat protein